MKSGMQLPESTTPYAIYYVPMGEKEKGQQTAGLPDFITKDPSYAQYESSRKTQPEFDSARADLIAAMKSRYNRTPDINPLDFIEYQNRFLMRPPRQQVCPLNRQIPIKQSNLAGISQLSSSAQFTPLNIPSSVPKINVKVTIEGGSEIIKIVNPDTLIANLFRDIIDNEISPSANEKAHYLSEYALFVNGEELDHMKTLRECELSNKTVDFARKSMKNLPRDEPASFSSVPILTKAGYQTQPVYSEICRMTDAQLAKVHNFAIMNKWGRIQFFDETDIRGLDLDRLVIIERGQIEVYPEGTIKPARGKGLNRPALITFFEYGLHNKKNMDEFIKKFKERATQMGAIYVGHDLAEDSITIQIEGTDN